MYICVLCIYAYMYIYVYVYVCMYEVVTNVNSEAMFESFDIVLADSSCRDYLQDY